VEKKVVPLLPTGAHPTLIDLPYYEKQREIKELRLEALLDANSDDEDQKE